MASVCALLAGVSKECEEKIFPHFFNSKLKSQLFRISKNRNERKFMSG
jgi:hypothetical protein